MDHRQVGRYWDGNAEAWTWLARAGYDYYRNQLNTPAFFDMLPEVAGLSGLDIGCGEGYNTRLLADAIQVFRVHQFESEESRQRAIRWISVLLPCSWTALSTPPPQQFVLNRLNQPPRQQRSATTASSAGPEGPHTSKINPSFFHNLCTSNNFL